MPPVWPLHLPGVPGLARDCRRPNRTVSPNLGGALLTVSGQGGKSTKGVLYH